ncbi:hypothetical protein NPIL_135551 [Nephila pilipes]|uniref:Uncharacterized protein n=1 Tax=Nephila pilipes TaxID=299642 RepID=A0A8X6TDS7_NEPPI|nr:hypothetical protein NPIL_135551 [Nephila pilipes]
MHPPVYTTHLYSRIGTLTHLSNEALLATNHDNSAGMAVSFSCTEKFESHCSEVNCRLTKKYRETKSLYDFRKFGRNSISTNKIMFVQKLVPVFTLM